jgi:RNA polymerase sigma-70 factor, ECF subfamily
MTAAAVATVADVEPAALTGPDREAAIGELHGLLLRAARFEISRSSSQLAGVGPRELDDLATQSADDALVAVLAKLDTFRGESRFTTWAYKFALLEAGVKARRRAWQNHETTLDHDGWRSFADGGQSPAAEFELRELLGELRDAIDSRLTPHQRTVLVALAIDGIPIDVLAERLGSTRGALYKTLHDARRKLRAHLAERGLGLDAEEPA